MAARPAALRRRPRRRSSFSAMRRPSSTGRTSSSKCPTSTIRGSSNWRERLNPDLIAVFGTSLIRGPLLGMGRLGIVNLHGGLSPEYRGADCTFWALYNGEPDKVGCTIHFIDKGIDTGNLIAHVSPAVKPGDDELTLFWRAVKDERRRLCRIVRTHRARRVVRPEPARQGQAVSGEGPRAAPRARTRTQARRRDARPCRIAETRHLVRAPVRSRGGHAGNGEDRMRDIAVTLAVFGSLPFILRRPWIGILVWTWLGFMNPHRLAWGFSITLPFARSSRSPRWRRCWCRRRKEDSVDAGNGLDRGVVDLDAGHDVECDVSGACLGQLNKVSKIFLMIFVATMLINTRERLMALVWMIALSLGFYGVKGGIFTLSTGGGYQVRGPAGIVHRRQQRDRSGAGHDRPVPVFPQSPCTEKVSFAIGMLAAAVLTAFAALGTQSRGALLGIGAMTAFLWLKSRSKIMTGILIALFVAMMLPMMPESGMRACRRSRRTTRTIPRRDGSTRGGWRSIWRCIG